MKKSKLKILIIILIVFLILPLLWWYNTFTIKINKQNITNTKINDEITIVHLTDLHGATFGNKNKTLINKIQSANPDLIIVTGDTYTSGSTKGKEVAVNLLSSLAKQYPVYYSNGEHDNSVSFWDELKNVGVHVLDNKQEKITIKDTPLHLYGISNIYYNSSFNLANKFTIDPNAFSILLAHIPNYNKFLNSGIDLSLCGDTHGGMIRLPFVGAIYTGDYWFPDIKGNHTKGMFSDGEHHMFISSGLGNYPIPIRLFNRPEIAVITLNPSK